MFHLTYTMMQGSTKLKSYSHVALSTVTHYQYITRFVISVMFFVITNLHCVYCSDTTVYVYWTVHHLYSRIKMYQLMSLALFFAAQHVSNPSTFIFRSLRLCVCILLRFDVCWRYGVVRLGWCGILMQAEALVPS